MAPKFSLNLDALRPLAEALGHTRPDGDLSPSRIGRHTGIDRVVVSRVIRGENGPDLSTAVLLAEGYETSIESLLVRETEPAT
ncbi:helix-turn-helix domain-containing protein [Peterkaempfera griseoplana]|uniref:helix-turn-helix domain-containing protein n=1 Tax=Peterkaempfera griseoplana TaxID=66896 RepID=UPI0006E18CFA|nr:helix-turn-helix transcriptional regulator [Peterkaempfera griseoplana]